MCKTGKTGRMGRLIVQDRERGRLIVQYRERARLIVQDREMGD